MLLLNILIMINCFFLLVQFVCHWRILLKSLKTPPKKQRYIMFKIPLTEIILNAILIMWHQAIYWEWKCLEKVCNSFKHCSCLFFFKGWNCFLRRKQNYAYLFLMSGSNKDKFYINNCHLKTWNEIGMPIHWMKHVI